MMSMISSAAAAALSLSSHRPYASSSSSHRPYLSLSSSHRPYSALCSSVPCFRFIKLGPDTFTFPWCADLFKPDSSMFEDARKTLLESLESFDFAGPEMSFLRDLITDIKEDIVVQYEAIEEARLCEEMAKKLEKSAKSAELMDKWSRATDKWCLAVEKWGDAELKWSQAWDIIRFTGNFRWKSTIEECFEVLPKTLEMEKIAVLFTDDVDMFVSLLRHQIYLYKEELRVAKAAAQAAANAAGKKERATAAEKKEADK